MSGKNHERDLSPREKRSFCLGLFTTTLFLTGLFALFAQPTEAKTWYIKADGTGDAPTIQAGVDSAVVGDTVLVGPGAYSDAVPVEVWGWNVMANVHATKSVSIIGENNGQGVTIDGSGSQISIFVEGSGTVALVRHLTMTRNLPFGGCIIDLASREPVQAFETLGILCQNGTVTLEENSMRDNAGIEIYLAGAEGHIIGNEVNGAGMGIYCGPGSNVEIVNNQFVRCVNPISGEASHIVISDNVVDGADRRDTCQGFILFGGRVSVSRNEITGTKFEAISLGAQADATIENNTITGCTTGLYLAGGDSTAARGNVFYGCGWAIDALVAPYALIENNTFDANDTGVLCQVGTAPIIRNNIIVRGGGGIICDAGSAPMFECNDLFQVGDPYYGCGDQTGVNGNISVDPEFCGIDDSGNYFLQSDSPCAPGNHPGGDECGLIGALGVNCGNVLTKDRSWGALKALFKEEVR
jgi:parallel beta-helix repeat protein